MNDKKNSKNKDQIISSHGTINILRILLVIIKRWIFVVIFTFIGAIFAVIYSGLIKEQFESHVEIEFRGGDLSNLSNMIYNQFGLSKSVPDIILPKDITITDLIAHVSLTPRIVDKIIESNQLKKVYHSPTSLHARRRFLSKVNVKVNDLGLLEINFKDENKEMAYKVILSYIDEIENYFRWKTKTIKEFSLKESESSIEQIKNELVEAKIKLKEFQEKHGIFDIELYAKQLAEHISELQLQLIQAKINYQVKVEEYNQLGTVTQRELKVFKENINIIERELERLKNSSEESKVAYNDLPSLNIKYMEEFTNVKSLTYIYEQLRLLYNTAKLSIDKDTEAFIVVNKPEIAEQKLYPFRSRMVLIFTVLFFFIAILFCFIIDFFERAFKNDEDKKLLLEIKEQLLIWDKDKKIQNQLNKIVYKIKELKKGIK